MRESHMRYPLPFLRRERKYSLLDVQSAKTRDQDYSLPSLIQRPKMIQKKYPWFKRHQEPKEVPSNLSQESPDSFLLVPDTAESALNAALPNAEATNPPNNPPKSPPNLVTESVEDTDHSFEEAEK